MALCYMGVFREGNEVAHCTCINGDYKSDAGKLIKSLNEGFSQFVYGAEYWTVLKELEMVYILVFSEAFNKYQCRRALDDMRSLSIKYIGNDVMELQMKLVLMKETIIPRKQIVYLHPRPIRRFTIPNPRLLAAFLVFCILCVVFL